MRLAIIGSGGIGEKRLGSIDQSDQVIACSDLVLERAERLAAIASKRPGANKVLASADWNAVVSRDDIDAVIVATTHNALPQVALAAVKHGKHVLLEKPGATSSAALETVLAASRDHRTNVRVGFNHRFHPALRKAKELVDAGSIGPLMFIRARYGHGGRLGYDREWRAKPEMSGGGELIDQGMHLIDLAQWFLGTFAQVDGLAKTFYWDMPVDDNGFLILKTADERVAFLHASCTEWKNTFSFEIYGRDGKLDINGLGRSYGLERLAFYRMLPEMGPPETTIWEYPGEDDSWKREWAAFKQDCAGKTFENSTCRSAIDALTVVEKIYQKSGYEFST